MSLIQNENDIYNEFAVVLRELGWTEERIAMTLANVNLEVAKKMTNLSVKDLETLIKNCRSCYGKELVTENGPVSGRGKTKEIEILFIGLMPGNTEEKTGKIFTGPNSKILIDSIAELGIGSEDCPIYAHNVVCCKPLGDQPKAEQRHNCETFTAALLAILNPNIVVTLGTTALSLMLGKTVKLEDYEGEVQLVGRYIIVPLKHPSALHRMEPGNKQQEAFQKYREQLAGIKRMNDRIKKLQQEGLIPHKGEFRASFFGEEEPDHSGDSQVQQTMC
jgi:uracil-DNA glycosylase family 4